MRVAFQQHKFTKSSEYTIKNWNDLIKSSQKEFIFTLFISSIPILGTILIIMISFAIISKLVTMKRLKELEERRREAKNIKDFLRRIMESNEEKISQEKKKKENTGFEDTTRSQVSVESRSNAEKKKNKRSNTFFYLNNMRSSRFNLPDENKVPLVLINESIQKRPETANTTQDSKNSSISNNQAPLAQIDEDILKLIKDLVEPAQNQIFDEIQKRKTPKRSKSIFRLFSINKNKEDEETDDNLAVFENIDELFGKKSSSSHLHKPIFNLNEGFSTSREESIIEMDENEGPIKIVVEDYDKMHRDSITTLYNNQDINSSNNLDQTLDTNMSANTLKLNQNYANEKIDIKEDESNIKKNDDDEIV
jgi:hypothetical protein